MPVFMGAGSGTGKSRLLGRLVGWQDLYRGNSQVILDPHGVTIDNLLDKLARLPRDVPKEIRERLWRRIRYVDMSGKSGYIVPFPLYYRLGNETLYTIAQRPIDTFGKIDPHLRTASIEGFSAVKRVGSNAGMLLTAMECQITEAADLLRRPDVWMKRAKRRLDEYGDELAPAVAFLAEYKELTDGARNRLRASFLNKIDQFELDPVLRAMFGLNQPGIDWHEVEREGQTVLLDFRHVHDLERRQFLMMWVYQYFVSFIKSRGAGRHQPISFIIDELAALFPMPGLTSDQFAADLDEMINQIARNYGARLLLASQELYQFSERLQKTLMSMTLILGRTSDPDAAAMLAQRLSRYDPYRIKKLENVWMSDIFGPYIVEKRPVEFTVEEQQILTSYIFQDLRKFEFLVRMPRSEGDLTGGIQRISIATLDPGHFPNGAMVAEARDLLMMRDGIRISDALAEIKDRREQRQMSHGGVQPNEIPASGEVPLEEGENRDVIMSHVQT